MEIEHGRKEKTDDEKKNNTLRYILFEYFFLVFLCELYAKKQENLLLLSNNYTHQMLGFYQQLA